MEITGKVVRLGALTEGTSARGPWRKQDEIQKFAPGQTIKAQIEISSREFNGKWYTDVRVWRFDPVGAVTAPAAAPVQPQPVQQPSMHQTPPPATVTTPEYYAPADDSTDDLPF